MPIINPYIKRSGDLVTSKTQTKAGFIEAALEKNRKAKPLIIAAKTLKIKASKAKNPNELLDIPDICQGLLTAAGLSDKAIGILEEPDKKNAIEKLIEEFLIPAGKDFIDELVYRFLLIKGDSLGGSMRNLVGTIAEMKLKRNILSSLYLEGKQFEVVFKQNNKAKLNWENVSYEEASEEAEKICAIHWFIKGKSRIIFFNAKIPLVNNNIDICLYKGNKEDYLNGNLIRKDKNALMFGELKGGIDPAGADEHWKTGNTALTRIRTAFNDSVKTSFIAAAIEKKMAKEIYNHLLAGVLTNAANMTDENQLTSFCQWLINI